MSCQFSKQTKLPFNKSDFISSTPFDFVHSDVWGLAPFTTEGGSRYFVIFVDEYSKFTWIYLKKHRLDLIPVFQTFHKMIQTQFSLTIIIFRSDIAFCFGLKWHSSPSLLSIYLLTKWLCRT